MPLTLTIYLRYTILLIFACCALQSIVPGKQDKSGLTLTVLLVQDPKVAPLPHGTVTRMLEEAESLLLSKLGVTVQLDYAGELEWKEIAGIPPQDYKDMDSRFLDIWAEQPNQRLKNHLAALPEEVVKSFAGHEHKTISSAALYLTKKIVENLSALKSLSDIDGRPLLEPGRDHLHSLAFWKYRVVPALRESKGADLVITNTLIVLDLLMGLHVLSHTGAVRGIGTLVSSFPVYSENPTLAEKRGQLSEREKVLIMGEIIAHEIGHEYFFLDDDYRVETRGCLMQRDGVTMNDRERHKLLRNHPPCRQEVAVATAVAGIREAAELKSEGKKEKALQIVEQVINLAHGDVHVTCKIFEALDDFGIREFQKQLAETIKVHASQRDIGCLWSVYSSRLAKHNMQLSLEILEKIIRLSMGKQKRLAIDELERIKKRGNSERDDQLKLKTIE